jgi:hypothetical protein
LRKNHSAMGFTVHAIAVGTHGSISYMRVLSYTGVFRPEET